MSKKISELCELCMEIKIDNDVLELIMAKFKELEDRIDKLKQSPNKDELRKLMLQRLEKVERG
jgi:hypothetical protein